ncbi:MAG: hypothetical protein IPF97_04135 [Sphingomonadales bacterium]|nr:hypothetical protein [Sphingomonadales bacterium]
MVRSNWSGPIIANNNLKAESARAMVSGRAEAVSFGRAFIANPDLPERSRTRAALRNPDHSSLRWRRTRLHRLSVAMTWQDLLAEL